MGIYPIGSLVRLQSGRLAVVVSQNSAALLSPKVKAFFSLKSDLRIEPIEIDLPAAKCLDQLWGAPA